MGQRMAGSRDGLCDAPWALDSSDRDRAAANVLGDLDDHVHLAGGRTVAGCAVARGAVRGEVGDVDPNRCRKTPFLSFLALFPYRPGDPFPTDSGRRMGTGLGPLVRGCTPSQARVAAPLSGRTALLGALCPCPWDVAASLSRPWVDCSVSTAPLAGPDHASGRPRQRDGASGRLAACRSAWLQALSSAGRGVKHRWTLGGRMVSGGRGFEVVETTGILRPPTPEARGASRAHNSGQALGQQCEKGSAEGPRGAGSRAKQEADHRAWRILTWSWHRCCQNA